MNCPWLGPPTAIPFSSFPIARGRGEFSSSLSATKTLNRLFPSAFEEGYNPSVSLSGEWVLYVDDRNEGGFSVPQHLMRVPLAGGHPEVVLTGHFEGQGCARSPATLCVFAERTPDRKQLIFTSFDPVNGRGKELTRMDVDSNTGYEWNLSPDGSRIAFHKAAEAPIQLSPWSAKRPSNSMQPAGTVSRICIGQRMEKGFIPQAAPWTPRCCSTLTCRGTRDSSGSRRGPWETIRRELPAYLLRTAATLR